jgi:hypothetical protein
MLLLFPSVHKIPLPDPLENPGVIFSGSFLNPRFLEFFSIPTDTFPKQYLRGKIIS